MKVSNVEKRIETAEVDTIVKAQDMSKSAKVRALFDGGLDVGEIAELLQIRYNFAYNVLQNHVIMNDIQVEKVERNSKRDEIVKLLLEKKTLAEVSRLTKTNYNYIWKISKELKQEITQAKVADPQPEATVVEAPKVEEITQELTAAPVLQANVPESEQGNNRKNHKGGNK
jgi:hypothetical protein